MEAYLLDWLNLFGRWIHLITGIAWIGASFYFVWLDNHLMPTQSDDATERGVSGELWAVHGGGFYNAQKYRVAPPALPKTLHWFYWEAYSTWLSGFFLLCVLYYANASLYLIDRSIADISPASAVAIGLGSMVAGWIVYDLLCKALTKYPRALAASISILIAALAYGLCHVFSGRGAFMQFGAVIGTIMVANVYFVIMPSQQEMVDAKKAGREPDPAAGARGKMRSVHNTYLTLPVLFVMISNHYSMTWGAPHNWLVLIALSYAGFSIRAWFVARHKDHVNAKKASPLFALSGVAVLLILIVALRPATTEIVANTADTAAAEFGRVQAIVAQRCTTCHSAAPKQVGFVAPPKGIMFDTTEQILAQTVTMRQQLFTKAMPIGNLSNMTDAERAALISWIDRGAPH